MTLLCGENVSRRISEGRPDKRLGNKGKQGEKEGKKESGSKKKKRPAAETDAGVQTKKAPKRFRFRASVKTATTYSPTCAVPSA